MYRMRELLLAAALTLIASVSTNAQPVPAIKPAVQPALKSPTSAPIRLYRKPPNIQLTPKVATNRVIKGAALTAVINTGLRIDTTRLQRYLDAKPPSKLALVVILENGGIRNNIDPALRQALDFNMRTAVCGNFEFEMRAGEDIGALLGRVGSLLASNVNCLNPLAWRIETVNLLDVVDEYSDDMLENVIKGQNSLLNTQSYYDRIVVLEDSNATPANVIAAMRGIAATHTIDVHVLTHGGEGYFVGDSGAVFNDASFFNPLKADTDARRMFLRAVYQMNCFSSTLKARWTSLGAIVANGTQNATLNSMPHQYMHFMGYWLQQTKGMQEGSQKSWEDAAFYTRPIYTVVGMGQAVDVSRLTATGTHVNANVATSR